jgi:hypothetical protein
MNVLQFSTRKRRLDLEKMLYFHLSSAALETRLKITLPMVCTSVSNPVYTDTGIPVFGTPNTDTGKNMPVFVGIENE